MLVNSQDYTVTIVILHILIDHLIDYLVYAPIFKIDIFYIFVTSTEFKVGRKADGRVIE